MGSAKLKIAFSPCRMEKSSQLTMARLVADISRVEEFCDMSMWPDMTVGDCGRAQRAPDKRRNAKIGFIFFFYITYFNFC